MTLLLNDGSAGETKEGYCQPLEKAELVRAGADVTILCYSRMRYVVMQAVAELEKSGYDPEAIPPPTPSVLESLPNSFIVPVCFSLFLSLTVLIGFNVDLWPSIFLNHQLCRHWSGKSVAGGFV